MNVKYPCYENSKIWKKLQRTLEDRKILVFTYQGTKLVKLAILLQTRHIFIAIAHPILMTLFTEKEKGNPKFHRPKQLLSETAVWRGSYLTLIILPSYYNKTSMAGRRQSQTDRYDFEASLLYIASSKSVIATQWDSISRTKWKQQYSTGTKTDTQTNGEKNGGYKIKST